jgi:beta-xylosidase
LKECITATEPWENTANSNWPVAEGPVVLKQDKLYFLFYTANDFRNPDYATGYAVSATPYGPWKKFKGNPIISRQNIGVNGTGHGDFVKKGKKLFYVFHTHHSDSTVSPRRTAIVRVRFVKDRKTGTPKLVVVKKSFFYPVIQKE